MLSESFIFQYVLITRQSLVLITRQMKEEYIIYCHLAFSSSSAYLYGDALHKKISCVLNNIIKLCEWITSSDYHGILLVLSLSAEADKAFTFWKYNCEVLFR